MTIKAEVKQQAVSLYRQGKSWFSVCFTCNISRATLYGELRKAGQPLQSSSDFVLEITDQPERKGLADMVAELEENNVPNPRVIDDWNQPLTHRKGEN